MDCIRTKLLVLELTAQGVSPSLGLGEDQHFLAWRNDIPHPAKEPVPLVVVTNHLDLVYDVFVHCQFLTPNRQLDWVLPTKISRQSLDFFRPCRRIHQSLSIWPDLRNNLADLWFE